MDTRLVVTGHDDNGRSIISSDEQIAPSTLSMMPGMGFNRLWGSDQAQTYPDAGATQHAATYLPPVGGSRLIVTTFPPDGDVEYPDDMMSAFEEGEAKLPGLIAHMDFDDPGMHATPTTDFDIVMSGRLIMELDDGATVELAPGDVVVQNGTRHRWKNPGTEPAVMATVMIGAHPR